MNAVAVLKQEIEAKLDQIDQLEAEIESLHKALLVLGGQFWSGQEGQTQEVLRPAVGRLESEPGQILASDVRAERPAKPVDTRPLCNACGSRMERGERTLSSGKTVPLLICIDSGCNNEQIAA